MSTRSQLTKDLNESVQALLGKHVKILLMNVVKYETKPEKTENRVLVFSPCRLFLLMAKVPPRVDTHCHYLEIQSIESRSFNQLSLVINEKLYIFYTSDVTNSQEVDNMVQALYTAIRNIFPTVPFTCIIRKVDIVPESRVDYIVDNNTYNEVRGVGPCGGFSTQYACMCDYHSLPYREEVAWDVDTIYLSHDTRELCMKDFDHLDPKDLVPIISALEYNTWFTKLRMGQVKLTHEAVERLLHIMKKSFSVEELYIDNLGLKWDFAHRLSLSLIANGCTVLHTLDLSNNLIEDKGASSLCGFIAKVTQGASHIKDPIARVPKGLIHLNLANCGLTSKGVSNISHALILNKCVPETLIYLNLSGNNLKDDVTNLCNFLAQPNVLSHLDISKTECSLENIFGALLRGCASNLVHLNVSNNVFNMKKNKELPPSFKQFFTSSLSLKYINMSSCKLPLDAVKNLLLGLACNETIADVTLDISCNNFGSQGAHVLESCVHGVRSISHLDISENSMDVDLSSVITAVSKNKSIKHLYMGRNIVNMKAKHVSTVMETLVQMIQDEDCVLQTLSIPDCKLKSDLYSLINALGGNQCLVTLDISGNLMGDGGARLLGKALQINTHLRSILYDRNSITLQGYIDLAYALESNYVMRYMPVPVHDILPCMKVSAEKTESVMKKIQDILHRNVSPKRYSNGHGFRLQQGFMLSSTQQMVDKLVAQTQEVLKSTTNATSNICDTDYVIRVIRDAGNSKHLLPYLHEVIQKNEQTENPVDLMLKYISNELYSTVTSYLQDMADSIVNAAEEECPTMFQSEKFQEELRNAVRTKNYLEPEFIHSCIVDQAGTQILNKMNDLNLAVATHVSDKVTDGVIESLSQCHRSIIGDDARNKRSSTPDVLRSMSRSSNRNTSTNLYSTQRDRSPIATPHLTTKRRSLHGRKLRPKSVVDNVEGMSANDIPDLLPSLACSADESLDSLSELPVSVNQQLQHLAKGRPKRSKTRATSRSHLRSQDDNEDSSMVETFFKLPGATISTTDASPSTEDSSISSLMMDVSPNQMSPNLEYDRNVKSKPSHNSLPKRSYSSQPQAIPAPRSRSTDNLSKFSPSSASPLARRIANFEGISNEGRSSILRNRLSSRNIPDLSNKIVKVEPSEDEQNEEDKKCYVVGVDLLQSHPCDASLLPLPCEKVDSLDNELAGAAEKKTPSPIGLKPRRWSMLDGPHKTCDENENRDNKPFSNSTTCSMTEPISESNPPEKKSVKELAASLIKQSKEPTDNQRKIETGFNFLKPRNTLFPAFLLHKTSQEPSEDAQESST